MNEREFLYKKEGVLLRHKGLVSLRGLVLGLPMHDRDRSPPVRIQHVDALQFKSEGLGPGRAAQMAWSPAIREAAEMCLRDQRVEVALLETGKSREGTEKRMHLSSRAEAAARRLWIALEGWLPAELTLAAHAPLLEVLEQMGLAASARMATVGLFTTWESAGIVLGEKGQAVMGGAARSNYLPLVVTAPYVTIGQPTSDSHAIALTSINGAEGYGYLPLHRAPLPVQREVEQGIQVIEQCFAEAVAAALHAGPSLPETLTNILKEEEDEHDRRDPL